MGNKFYTDERNVQIVISLLKAHGVKKIVTSPGTTNITFVGSLQQDPFFELYSSVDERSAAYIACGLAAESGEPVGLSCTGATASRNYYSGLTEAYYRKLPIVAITSHQGNNRIGHLIAQNIDRRRLPNDIVKISVEAPIIRCSADEEYCIIEVNKALLELKHRGGGPVHINLFTTYSRDFNVQNLPPVRVINRYTQNDELPVLPEGRIGIFVGAHPKFSDRLNHAIDKFCASRNAVVFCDHTSGYNGKYKAQMALVISQQKYITSNNLVNLIIHMGEISGDYKGSGIKGNQVWRVSEDGELRDTFGKLTNVFEMPEYVFFEYYAGDTEVESTFIDSCTTEYTQILSKFPEIPFGNIWIAKTIAPRIPEGAVLHLGILNSLRSWNLFTKDHSIFGYSNVGGFGIDGCVSSLIGASLVNKNKLYFGVVGDLAFFYDMNSIGNRHIGENLRLLIINNGKGGEFRNYRHPGSEFGEEAEPYIAAAGHYGNKSTTLVKYYVESLGFRYLAANNKKELLDVADEFLNPNIGSHSIVLECFVTSEDDYEALKSASNYIVNSMGWLKNNLKTAVKETFGKNCIEKIKGLLK